TTAFLVGEYASDDVAKCPEFAVADGMVELLRNKLGTRDERFLRVLKLRGSNYLEGMHAFRLGPDGSRCTHDWSARSWRRRTRARSSASSRASAGSMACSAAA